MVSWFMRGLPLVLVVSACSVGPPEPTPVGRVESAIINGAPDKAHPAVVALMLGDNEWGGACTGTIVKTDPARKIGWVATAAHCVKPGVSLVVQGEDYWSGGVVTYTVLDYEADRRFSLARGYDFAMVRVGGVDASTPVMPLTTAPDGLSVGGTVTSVGYGTTGGGVNTERRFVDKPVSVLTDRLIGYAQEDSGVCFGDSGGPVIAGAGASARVVGIHSYVTPDCSGEGYSARVTSGLDFFDAQLDKALPEPTCDTCGKIATGGAGTCASLTRSCLEDDSCRGYFECIANGRTQASCFSQFPSAEGPFVAAASCVCGEACPSECAGDASCEGVGACGFALEEDECGACVESACCEEVRDCTADGSCYRCLKADDRFGMCKRSETRAALAACARDRCATECAGSTLPTIGEEPSEAAESEADSATDEAAGGCSSARPAPAGAGWAALAPLLMIVLRRRRGAG